MNEYAPLIRMDSMHTEALAKLLAICFADDPLTIIQTKNITKKEDFLIKLFREQLGIFSKTRDVFLLNDQCRSVLIGCERKGQKLLKEILLGIQASGRIKKQIGKSDFKTYAGNLKVASGAVDLNWHKSLNLKNFYYINVIAVDRSEKGKGRFRAMFSPVLAYSNKQNIPVILETVNPGNIPIFEHFGFQLIKTIESKQTGIVQYCFIKNPETVPLKES